MNILKIIVDKEFKHEGKKYEPGETVELPDSLAKDIIDKGFAKNAEKIEENLEVKPADEVETEQKEKNETDTDIKPIEKKEKTKTREKQEKPKKSEITQKQDYPEDTLWKNIEKELNQEPSKAPKWEPSEPGEQLLGEIIRTGKGPNGRFFEVKTPEGENYIVWERVALEDMFDRADAGDKIGIRFLGKEESSSGRSYYNFRTAVRK